MRRFDACALCLQTVREPVACNEGHMFCKECVYTDLLSQKKDIKRQKAKLEALVKEAEEEKQRAKTAARERVLQEFERGHIGLAARSVSSVSSAEKDKETEPRGTKRKLEFSPGHVDRLADAAEEAALKQIQEEQAEALKSKLPDFWLPSLTPTYTSSGPPRDLKDIKVRTVCRGGTSPHDISLKSLTPVTFTFPSGPADSKDSKSEEKSAMCPSCKKDFSNSVIMFLMKPCTHVVCKTCTETLVRPASQCVVCDTPVDKKDQIELRREGTGFAGGGLAETSKAGVAFQG